MIFLILGMALKILINILQKGMIQQTIEFSLDLEQFTHERTFIFISEDIHDIPCIIIFFSLISFIMIFVATIYLTKRELGSLIRNEFQKTLIVSIIAQLIAVIILELVQFLFFVSAVKLKILHSGPLVEFMTLLEFSHSFLDYYVTLYFVLPCRNYVGRKLELVRRIFDRLFLRNRVFVVKSISTNVNFSSVLNSLNII